MLFTFVHVFFSGGVALLSFHFRLLTATGFIAQFFLAIIYGLGEWQFTIPILSFFLFSSLVSKLSNIPNASAKQYFDKGSARDVWQVMANRGVPAAMVIVWWFTGFQIFYIGYLSGVSVAAADTWATEI